MTGPPDFKMLAACSHCFKQRKFCSRIMPCDQCEMKGHSCSASSMETVARAKAILKSICNYDYPYNDYAMYALHLQSSFYKLKPIIVRTEVKDIYTRLHLVDQQHGIVPVPYLRTHALPERLQEMVQISNCYKIETMDSNGEYHVQASDVYMKNFIAPNQTLGYAKKYSILPKLVDNLGATEHDISYKMWIESLRFPHDCIIYKGFCIWRELKQLNPTSIFMASSIVSMGQIVTVTCVTK